MRDSIYILSQPIQSGKTSLLMKWVLNKPAVGGFLTPDVNGMRKLYDIKAQQYHDLQLPHESEGIRIGRFRFDPFVFAKAHKLMKAAFHSNYDWVVIDEIGRLEMERNEGLEPEISALIRRVKKSSSQTKLLLVIRDYLLEDAIKQYELEDATVLDKTFFEGSSDEQIGKNLTRNNLYGVVLCGGQSVRMGRDKAFIKYHATEQYIHVADMMKQFCRAVYISCNTTQRLKINEPYQLIEDNATFANAGPMTGLLSAFSYLQHSSLLISGCDYPYFTEADMKALTDSREDDADVVCYHNPESGFDEPLLAIYEKQCAPLLLEFYQSGSTSLQQFLKTVRTKRILPSSLQSLTSIDQPL